jgi:hypothetical protein
LFLASFQLWQRTGAARPASAIPPADTPPTPGLP